MKWFDLYKSEFGRDISGEFDTYEKEFRRFDDGLRQDEVFQAIRDLKLAHNLTKCYDIRLPGPSDIVRQVKRNRKKGDGGKRYIHWMKARVCELNSDAEVFNAIVDPVNFLGASRDTRPGEISSLFAWAEKHLGFSEKVARSNISDEVSAQYKELKDQCDQLTEKWGPACSGNREER